MYTTQYVLWMYSYDVLDVGTIFLIFFTFAYANVGRHYLLLLLKTVLFWIDVNVLCDIHRTLIRNHVHHFDAGYHHSPRKFKHLRHSVLL